MFQPPKVPQLMHEGAGNFFHVVAFGGNQAGFAGARKVADPDGTFERCQTAGAMGFGGTNCFLLNVNNLGSNPPYVGP